MKTYIFIAALTAFAHVGYSQLYDANWIIGKHDCLYPFTPPSGNLLLDFNNRPVTVEYRFDFCMRIGFCNNTMSSKEGTPLFCTNTRDIKNNNNIKLNNVILAPGPLNSIQGPTAPDASMCLPLPLQDSIFYYFYPHLISPNPTNIYCDTLYYCKINTAANGGQGTVQNINEPLLIDTLSYGHVTATKHANGRDWWILFQEYKKNCYWTFLLGPDGLSAPFEQCIGDVANNPLHLGQAVFSPDGSIYATYNVDSDLELLDFDRCSGMLSNPRNYYIHDSMEIANASLGGMSFSPNGRFAYVSSGYNFFQFDLEVQDVQGSLFLLDTSVFIYPTLNGWALHQLAPDGRIYISSGVGMQAFHIVRRPNEQSLRSMTKYRGFPMIAFESQGLPNHPNFRLGPLDGSACDTLGLDQALATHIDRLDFGQVQVGQDSVRTFWLSNPGEAPLEVTEFYYDSTGFSSSTPLPFTVPPHDSVAVLLTFHPTAEQLYDAQLTMYHNGIFGISTVMLTGEGVNFNSTGSLPHLLSGVSIQPNPSSGLVQVAWPTGAFPQKLIVYDALGRTALLQGVSGSGTVLDGSRLPPGVYTVVVEGYWPVKWVVE